MTEPVPDNFASLPDLQNRLDWDLDTDEQRIATSALEDASDLARFYGDSEWTSTTAPRQVRTIVLRVCEAYMRNPDGYIQSRAGDETVTWSDTHKPASILDFTEEQQKILRDLAGGDPELGSIDIQAWGTTLWRNGYRYRPRAGHAGYPFGLDPSEVIYASVEGGGKGFPL